VTAGAQGRRDRFEGVALGIGERGRKRSRRARSHASLDRRRPARDRLGGDRHEPAGRERLEGGVADPGPRAQISDEQRPVCQRLEGGVLARTEARAFGPKRPPPFLRQFCGEQLARSAAGRCPGGSGAGRQDEREAARRGRAVALGDPQAELDELRRHPLLEALERLDEPLRRQVAGRHDVHDEPMDSPPPERHEQDGADSNAHHPARDAVVERPAQRTGRGERLDLGNRHFPPNLSRGADGRWLPNVWVPIAPLTAGNSGVGVDAGAAARPSRSPYPRPPRVSTPRPCPSSPT
jgi:hypothetical protein